MKFENLILEVSDGIALIKINRPKALNAINKGVLKDLEAAIQHITQDVEARVVILTGEGDKAFVAGADIASMQGMSALDAKDFCDLGHRVMRLIETCPKVIIAAVNGFCLGGGLELALSCDFIYASENAKLGLPEVNLGLFPGFGGTQRLARLIGKNKAKELIFSASILSAEQASYWGIVNKVWPADTLLESTKKIAREISSKGPIAVSLAKQAINEGADLDLGSGLAIEKNIFPIIFATEDKSEGVAAFLERRKAAFKGK